MRKHIVIEGTGRAGTSFLVQLLTRMGEDTGFTPGKEKFKLDIRAGCEFLMGMEGHHIEHAPRIFKSPASIENLRQYIENKTIKVELFICPVRLMNWVVESRFKTGLRLQTQTKDALKEVLYRRLGELVEVAVLHDIPMLFLKFPKIVKDCNYCYNQLSKYFDFDRKEFDKVYKKLANPKSIQFK